MKSRRVYLTSVVALFALAIGAFVIGYVLFFESRQGINQLTQKALSDYQAHRAKMKPFKLLCAALPPISMIGVMACSIIALDHTDRLKMSPKAVVITLCSAIALFLFTILSATF